MKNDRTGQHSSKRLVRIAPIIRGLLARPTGNEDVPYEGVILKSLTNKEAVDFAVLARGTLLGRHNVIKDVTGASSPAVLGTIALGR